VIGSCHTRERKLGDELVLDWLKNDRLVELGTDKVTSPRLHRLSLAVDNFPLGLRLLLSLLVSLDPVEELLSAARVLHMLNTNVDSLSKNTLSNTFVDDDTQSVLSDIVYNTGTTMVHLVWHTFLYSSITADVDDVSLLVRLHVL